jgi:hypothetical protein
VLLVQQDIARFQVLMDDPAFARECHLEGNACDDDRFCGPCLLRRRRLENALQRTDWHEVRQLRARKRRPPSEKVAENSSPRSGSQSPDPREDRPERGDYRSAP